MTMHAFTFTSMLWSLYQSLGVLPTEQTMTNFEQHKIDSHSWYSACWTSRKIDNKHTTYQKQNHWLSCCWRESLQWVGPSYLYNPPWSELQPCLTIQYFNYNSLNWSENSSIHWLQKYAQDKQICCYEVKIEKKPVVTRNWIKDTWLEPPVHHRATTTGQPDNHLFSQSGDCGGW